MYMMVSYYLIATYDNRQMVLRRANLYSAQLVTRWISGRLSNIALCRGSSVYLFHVPGVGSFSVLY